MSISKVCALIIVYFISRAALAANCETHEGLELKETLCWHESHKAWLNQSCFTKNDCEALTFFKTKKMIRRPAALSGQNPASLYCRELKLNVIILKDSEGYEQSYCVFPDKSVIDVNAIERHVR